MTLKKTLIGVAVIVVIAGAAFAWWLLSPLFLNTTVEEEFPFSATADMPVGMTQTEAEDIMQGMAKVDMEEMEDMPDEMAQAVALSSGMFRDADSFHKGSGTATIYRLPDGMRRSPLREPGRNQRPRPASASIHPSRPAEQGGVERGRVYPHRKAQGQSRKSELRTARRRRPGVLRLCHHLLYAIPRHLQRRSATVGQAETTPPRKTNL